MLTFAKLHGDWNALSAEYDRLWHHWRDDDSERIFYELVKRGQQASQQATTEGPYDKKLMSRMEEFVFSQYGAVA